MPTYKDITNLQFLKDKIRIVQPDPDLGTKDTDIPLSINQWFKFYVEKNPLTNKIDFVLDEVNDTSGANEVYFHLFNDAHYSIYFSELTPNRGGGLVWSLEFEFIGIGDIRVGRTINHKHTKHMLNEPQYLKRTREASASPLVSNQFAYATRFNDTLDHL